MEPYSLPQLTSLLTGLQAKLAQTSSSSKRFKLALKIDKCRALIEQRAPTPTATATKNSTSSSSAPAPPPPPFSAIAPPRPPTAAELARRASRFERDDDKHPKRRPGDNLTLRDARRRAESKTAKEEAAAKKTSLSSSFAAAATAFGRSKALEKPYLRLTSLPTVADVRPPRVLAEALELLKKKWREERGGGGEETERREERESGFSRNERYQSYFREQLKSIRQDLVVQAVRGKFAVDVYETHARIALESGDVAEFNQCQTALEELYREAERGLEEEASAARRANGAPSSSASASSLSSSFSLCLRNRAEFSSYRILYSQAMSFSSKSPSSSAINLSMQRVREEDRRHPFVLAALRAAALARGGDARALAAVLEEAPRMSPYLLDLLLPHARSVAARALVAGWRGGGGAGSSSSSSSSSLADAARLLGFPSSSSSSSEGGEGEELAAAAELLRAAGAVVDVAAGTVSVPRSSSGAAAAAAAAVAAAPLSKSNTGEKRGRSDDDGGDMKKKEKKNKKKRR